MDEIEANVNQLIEKKGYREATKNLYRQLNSKNGAEQSKERAEIYELLARVCSRKGDFVGARKCLNDACKEYDPIGGVYKYVESFLIDGDHYLKDGDFRNAQIVYEGGLKVFPDDEALKHGLKDVKEKAEKSAALMASKLIQEEEQKKKRGPKINEGKLIQKKKGKSNKGKEKLKVVGKLEKLILEEKQEKIPEKKQEKILEEKQKKLIQEEEKEVKRMDQEDIHNQCEDNVDSSDSNTYTVNSKITLFAESCQGILESDYYDPIAKSFLKPTPIQVQKFSVLHTLCSSDGNLLNVENVVGNREKTSPLLVTECVETLEGFFNNELKKISGTRSLTREMWWGHIAYMFRQIFRDYSRGLLFLFSSAAGFCGDLSFCLYVTNEKRGKILPSLKSKGHPRKDVADWVQEMFRIIFLPFKNDNILDKFEMPVELVNLLQCDFFSKYTNSPGILATFLVDHPFFWTKQERVNFIIRLKTLLKIHNSAKFKAYMDDFDEYKTLGDKLSGVYKAIFDKGEVDIKESLPPGAYRVHKYNCGKDIVQYVGSVYSHINDDEYDSVRGYQVISVDEVEEDLSSFFPTLYVDIYESICMCLSGGRNLGRSQISPELVRNISTYHDQNG